MDKRTVILSTPTARETALRYVREALDGWVMTLAPANRTLEQNAKFHAICGDLAKSDLQWMGKRRSARQWKVLLISGHAVATKEEVEMVPGLEGEFVNVRESTALMSKRRGSSLIEYSLAFCAMNGVELSDPSLRRPEPLRLAA